MKLRSFEELYRNSSEVSLKSRLWFHLFCEGAWAGAYKTYPQSLRIRLPDVQGSLHTDTLYSKLGLTDVEREPPSKKLRRLESNECLRAAKIVSGKLITCIWYLTL